MHQTISKAVLSGIGFASLAGDTIRETAHDLVKQSKLTEEEGRRVVKEFRGRMMKAQKTLEKKVHAEVRKALARLDPQPARRAKSTKANSHGGRKHAKHAAGAH